MDTLDAQRATFMNERFNISNERLNSILDRWTLKHAIPPFFYLIPEIKKVSYNTTITTIHWSDGTKTIVRCGQGENFDKYTGFMAAVCKKLFGSTTAAKNICSRVDAETLKADAVAERAKNEAIAKQKREKREKEIIKRRAKEFVIEMRARTLANEMLNVTHELTNRFGEF